MALKNCRLKDQSYILYLKSYIGPSFQSIITEIGTKEEYLFQNTKTTKFHEITFSKYCSFDSHGDVINPKLARKSVSHVLMVIRNKNQQ